MNIALTSIGTLLAMLAATAAMAESNGPRFGVQASVAVPLAAKMHGLGKGPYPGLDVASGFASEGFGISASVEWWRGPNGAFRAKAEVLSFGSIEPRGLNGFRFYPGLTYDMKMVGLTAEYLYGFASVDSGPYVLGGLGCYSTKGDGEIRNIDWDLLYDLDMDGSGDSLAFCVGAGHNFTKRFGCEAKFTQMLGLKHKIRYNDPSFGAWEEINKINFNWLQVSLCYRF